LPAPSSSSVRCTGVTYLQAVRDEAGRWYLQLSCTGSCGWCAQARNESSITSDEFSALHEHHVEHPGQGDMPDWTYQQCDVCWSSVRPTAPYVAAATGARGIACLDEHACADEFSRRPKGARRAHT
jgi:hypothetical protein